MTLRKIIHRTTAGQRLAIAAIIGVTIGSTVAFAADASLPPETCDLYSIPASEQEVIHNLEAAATKALNEGEIADYDWLMDLAAMVFQAACEARG